MRKGNLLAIKFSGKKDVYVVVDGVDAATEVVKEQILPDNVRVDINKPMAIERYNAEMGGVDICRSIRGTLRYHTKDPCLV